MNAVLIVSGQPDLLALTPELEGAGLSTTVLEPARLGEIERDFSGVLLLDLRDLSSVATDRLAAARTAAGRAGAVVVHKGAGTIVARPDGQYGICPLVAPGLASAGTGDVLTGLIAALLGGGMAAWDAARLGVYLHARSGQMAAAGTAVAGVLAADLAPLIPLAWAELESGRPRPIGPGPDWRQ